MRTLKLYTLHIICLLMLAACSKKESELKLNKLEPSTIDAFPFEEYELQNPEDQNPLLVTATWTEAAFVMDGNGTSTPVAPVKYTLQIDKAGAGFESPQVLGVTSSLTTNIYTKDLNFLLIDSLGATPGQKIEVELRLLINYGQNLTSETVSSNVIKLSFTPFTDRDPLQAVYIIGDMNGWNNSNTSTMLMMFKDNSSTSNHTYTYTGYMRANSFYKFLPKESLGSYKAYCFKSAGQLEYVESDGGALYNEAAGYKTITINLRDLTYSVEDYDASGAANWGFLGFIGSFCGWDNEPGLTRLSLENAHIWTLNQSLDPLSGGNTHAVKFRANKSWGSRWAAIDPDAVPYGRTIFLTGSEFDPNVTIREGGNYLVVFNDLTGHYIIMKQ